MSDNVSPTPLVLIARSAALENSRNAPHWASFSALHLARPGRARCGDPLSDTP
ncbi:hypothetical protein ACFPRL_08905 [Pseudoclavibacter helvolus]